MSKYHALWEWLAANGNENITLSYDEIAEHAGVPLDHSFLTYKKALGLRLRGQKDIYEGTDRRILQNFSEKGR